MTENSFKTRYTLHKSSLRHSKHRNQTELSNLIRTLTDKGTSYKLTWNIIEFDRARPYRPGKRTCNLCLSEKYHILVGSRKRLNQELFAEPEPPIFFAEPNRTEPNRTETEPNFCAYDLRSYELKLIKVFAELANLNHCAVPFLSRTAVNLSLYNSSPVMK